MTRIKAVLIVGSLMIWGCGNETLTSNESTTLDTVPALTKKGVKKGTGSSDCVTIQSGDLLRSDGEVITPGFDEWGYNYQARIFNGDFCGASRTTGCADEGVDLIMKWNAAWLDNKSCDGDLVLDRHNGHPSYIGSGAWLTNHMSGTNDDGSKWTYFTKIVAAPADAEAIDGVWYTADGEEIGPVLWGQFATIQIVENDPSSGTHGKQYGSPVGPGFGKFKP